MGMIKTLEKFIKKYSFDKKKTFLISVSGGMDSVCLWDICARLKKKLGLSYEVIHFNFHLRGSESNRDEKFVRERAKMLGDKLRVFDTPLKKGSGIQKRAREARLNKLAWYCKKRNSTVSVLLAHHEDDQIETYLMRNERGAGEKGLAAMAAHSPQNGFSIYRPLLKVPRRKISVYIQKHKLTFVEDSSNAGLVYLRNRIRHQEVPKLDLKARRHIVKEIAFNQRQALIIEKKVADFLKGQGEWISKAAYFDLPQAVRFAVFRVRLKDAACELTEKGFAQIEQTLQLSRFVKMPFGQLLVVNESSSFGIFTKETWQMKTAKVEPVVVKREGLYLGGNVQIGMGPYKLGKPKGVALSKTLFLNPDKVAFPLVIRSWHDGETIAPFGRHKPQKIKDFLGRKGLTHSQKRSVLGLYQKSNQLIALIGVEIDARYALESPPVEALMIKIVRSRVDKSCFRA